MDGLKKALKLLLKKVEEMIDNNECDHLTDSDIETVSQLLLQPKAIGREEAAKYLGVSLNEFHKLRNEGIIKEPRKLSGFKELYYYTSDLKKSRAIINCKDGSIG